MAATPFTDGPPPCGLCGAPGPTGACAAGHAVCGACAAAITRTVEKILGDPNMPGFCPQPDCNEAISAAGPAGRRQAARLVGLEAGGDEYAAAAAALGKTMPPTLAVQKVYRVENPALRAVYGACRERLGGQGANEKTVFHATTREAAGAIVQEGFDAHRAGSAHGATLGPGIYVAATAMFSHGYSSPDSAGLRAMFVCQALVGADKRNSKTDLYLQQYVIFREQQVVPTHLVYYRC